MKHVFALLLVLFVLAVPLLAAGGRAQCWSDYQDQRAVAKQMQDNGDFMQASDEFIATSNLALKLKNWDGTDYLNAIEISDWQINNAAYMLILAWSKEPNPEQLPLAKRYLLSITSEAVLNSKSYKNNLAFIKEHLKGE
jgi:hypothetical protein